MMGYTTEFDGRFDLDKPLSDAHKDYLKQFSSTRRMKRNVSKAAELSDPLRVAVNLDLGVDACYFVGGAGFAGQDRDSSIVDYNKPPTGQPDLWCQWVPSEDGDAIEWDGGEKFYDYVEWIEYIIKNFLVPWGYSLNGKVGWRGEDFNDMGYIIVQNNVVTTERR